MSAAVVAQHGEKHTRKESLPHVAAIFTLAERQT